MSVDPAAVALGVVGCGAAGLLVPALIRRVPEPEPVAEPDVAAGAGPGAGPGPEPDPKPPYAAIAAEPRLPLLAAGTSAVAGGLVGASVGLAWPLLFLLPLVPVGVALAVIDLRTRLLPTVVVWPLFGGVVLLGTVSALLSHDPAALVRGLLGAVGVFAFFYVLWWVYPAGMGFGDVRLSAVVGFALAYLGWPELLIGVYGGFLAFSVPGLVVALVRRDRRVLKVAYPFGPFLLGGALAGVVLGGTLWSHLVTG